MRPPEVRQKELNAIAKWFIPLANLTSGAGKNLNRTANAVAQLRMKSTAYMPIRNYVVNCATRNLASHARSECFLQIRAAALLIFLSAAARAGIVSSDLVIEVANRFDRLRFTRA